MPATRHHLTRPYPPTTVDSKPLTATVSLLSATYERHGWPCYGQPGNRQRIPALRSPPQRTTKPFWNAGGSPPLFFHPQRSIKAQQNGSNSPETARGSPMGRGPQNLGRTERIPTRTQYLS